MPSPRPPRESFLAPLRDSLDPAASLRKWAAITGLPRREPWGPIRGLLLVLVSLVALNLALALADGEAGKARMAWLGPLALALACSVAGYRTVAAKPLTVFTPLPWFLASCAAYFGFGPLVYRFGSPATRERLAEAWPVAADQLFRIHLLDVVGILLVLVGFQLAWRRLRPRHAFPRPPAPGSSELAWLAAFHLAIGIFVTWTLALPHEQQRLAVTLPGSLYWLREFSLSGLVLLGYLAARERGLWIAALVGILLFQLAIGFLSFSKTGALLSLVAAVLGVLLHLRNPRQLALAAAVVAVVYVQLQPIVIWGRAGLQRAGLSQGAGLDDRWAVIRDQVARLDPAVRGQSGPQGWWRRLSYAQAQSFVLRERDAGRPGHSLHAARWVFVPRLLFPGKPKLSLDGTDLNEAMWGRRSSSTGIGIFAEAYWNGGWLCVVVLALWVGLLFAGVSRFALEKAEGFQLAYLPCFWLAIQLGFRVDGWFVIDYLGRGTSFLLYALLLGWLLAPGRGAGLALPRRRPLAGGSAAEALGD